MSIEELKAKPLVFEKVIEHYLCNPSVGTVYFEALRSHPFKSRALLYAICEKELHCNKGTYTNEELTELEAFISNIGDIFSDDDYIIDQVQKNGSSSFYNCLLFFANKMAPRPDL